MNWIKFFDEDNLSQKIKLEKKQFEINQKFNNINFAFNNSSFKYNSNLINNRMNNSIPNKNINELAKNSKLKIWKRFGKRMERSRIRRSQTFFNSEFIMKKYI